MSGGSFNYLCYKDLSEVLQSGVQDMEEMAEALEKLGYADDVAKETRSLVADIRTSQARLDSRLLRLAETWKAMEWWVSGDRGEDQFKATLAEYREKEERRSNDSSSAADG